MKEESGLSGEGLYQKFYGGARAKELVSPSSPIKKILRRNTEITGISFSYSDFDSRAVAVTNNGVGFVAFTVKSGLEPKHNADLAKEVLTGRLRKALRQYRRGGRVNVKLTTLIPARSM